MLKLGKTIQLSYGAGGRMMEELIKKVITPCLNLNQFNDAGIIDLGDQQIALTTDSYTVDPLFFPGGDIGSLAVYGTINDLAVTGAEPLAMTLAYIIEEGLDLRIIKKISQSVGRAAVKSGVSVITGDTKVMQKGKIDKIVLNTAGVGLVKGAVPNRAKPGDAVLVSGTMGNHGMALLAERFGFNSSLESDSYPLWGMIKNLLPLGGIHMMRDPTRGGFTAVINEFANKAKLCFYLEEDKIPIKRSARALAESLGIDPLSTACEGRVIMVSDPNKAEKILAKMRESRCGRDAALIGRVKKSPKAKVILKTTTAGERILEPPIGEIYPRIC